MRKTINQTLAAISIVLITCVFSSCGGKMVNITEQKEIDEILIPQLKKSFGEETQFINIRLFSTGKFTKNMTTATVTCIEPDSEQITAYTLELKNGKKSSILHDSKYNGYKTGLKLDEIAFNMIPIWLNTAANEMLEAKYEFSGVSYYDIGIEADEFMLTSKQGTTSQRRGKRTTYTTNYFEFKFISDENGVRYIENK